MTVYRTLNETEIVPALFSNFVRKQVVQKVLRRAENGWAVVDAPFIDDWSAEEYLFLCDCLQNTVRTGGFVLGAFYDGRLKGFASVEPGPLGSYGQYLDLSCIHVSADMRGEGIGKHLFQRRSSGQKRTARRSSIFPRTQPLKHRLFTTQWAAWMRRNRSQNTWSASPMTASWNMLCDFESRPDCRSSK